MRSVSAKAPFGTFGTEGTEGTEGTDGRSGGRTKALGTGLGRDLGGVAGCFGGVTGCSSSTIT